VDPLAVDVREAARLTSLSVFTIRRYIQRGMLGATRVGRRVIVPREALERLIREGSTSAHVSEGKQSKPAARST